MFVAQLEDRLVVSNDLNRTILARLIEEKILDPTPAAEFKLRDLDALADALRGRDEPIMPPRRRRAEEPPLALAAPAAACCCSCWARCRARCCGPMRPTCRATC